MQVYVHRDGQNLGPYSIGQLRPYLQAGNFTGDDLACHDGANWVALKDVPGIIGRANKQAPQTRITKKELAAKPRKKLFILLGVGILVVSLVGISAYFLLKKEEIPDGTNTLTGPGQLETTPERVVKTSVPDEEEELEDSKPLATAGLFEITPEQVVEVYDGDTFKIDLQGLHPLFGDKLPIRVKGIDTPEMRGTSEEVKALAVQARELTENTLKSAKKIELRNPERGKYFRVVAEVWVDGKALAGILKAKGLAKDYDGEGERPEW
jgi:micrococcal nuclease